MIYITFPAIRFKLRLKAIALLYISTFFIGGLMNSLYYYTKLGFYFQEIIHGGLYQNRNATYFLMSLFVGGIVTIILIKTLQELKTGGLRLYETELYFEQQKVKSMGLYDTGNCLYDPISKKPVLVAELSMLRPLFKESQYNFLQVILDNLEGKKEDKSTTCAFDWEKEEDEGVRIMMIPFHSLGKSGGVLPAIILNRVVIWNESEPIISEKVYVGLRNEKLSTNKEYQLILHRDMM